jgi:hypothetical protein
LPIYRKFTIFVVEFYFWHAIFLDYFSKKWHQIRIWSVIYLDRCLFGCYHKVTIPNHGVPCLAFGTAEKSSTMQFACFVVSQILDQHTKNFLN